MGLEELFINAEEDISDWQPIGSHKQKGNVIITRDAERNLEKVISLKNVPTKYLHDDFLMEKVLAEISKSCFHPKGETSSGGRMASLLPIDHPADGDSRKGCRKFLFMQQNLTTGGEGPVYCGDKRGVAGSILLCSECREREEENDIRNGLKQKKKE